MRKQGSKYPLGVLFVHGIGDQQRGESLAGWTDAINRYIHDLFTQKDLVLRQREHREQRERVLKPISKPSDEVKEELCAIKREAVAFKAAETLLDSVGSPVNIQNTRLRVPSDENDPAHLQLDVTWTDPWCVPLSKRSYGGNTQWLLAESWWAQEFNPPSAMVMLRWAITVAPMVVVSHFALMFSRVGDMTSAGPLKRRILEYKPLRLAQRALRLVSGVVLYVVSVVLLVVLLLVLVLLIFLSVLPIPRLSTGARSLGTRLASSVGDSYVLVASPTEYDAMVSRVERDLAWLADRCDRVAVVSHSQGAVIAHRALKRNWRPEVRLFVTVGSGLRKLTDINMLPMTNKHRVPFIMLGSLLVALAVVAFYLWFLGTDPVTVSFGVVLGLVYLAISYQQFRSLDRDRAHENVQRERLLELRRRRGSLSWADFFASGDPVPNGPIFEKDPPWLHSHQCWYESSWLRDHSSYRHNSDGLIGPLLCELGRCANDGLGAGLAAMADDVLLMARRRGWRCRLLVTMRWLLVIASILFTYAFWDLLQASGEAVREWGDGSVNKAVRKLASVFLVPPEADLHVESTLAVLLAISGTYVLFSSFTWLWRQIGDRDVYRFYRGDLPDSGGLTTIIFFWALYAVLALSITSALTQWRPDKTFPWFVYIFGPMFVYLASFLLLVESSTNAVRKVGLAAHERNREFARAKAARQTLVATIVALPVLYLTALVGGRMIGNHFRLITFMVFMVCLLGFPFLAAAVAVRLSGRIIDAIERVECQIVSATMARVGRRDACVGNGLDPKLNQNTVRHLPRQRRVSQHWDDREPVDARSSQHPRLGDH